MSRNEEFKSSAMFHGSTYPFEVGDTVLPSMYLKHNGDLVAYASSDPNDARAYAEGKTTDDSDSVNVYTVEPLDQTEVKSRPSGYAGIDGITHHTSVKGFKVTGVHGE